MSGLIQIDPEAKLNPEPEGYEFGYHAFEDLEPIKSDIQEIKVSTEPITLPQEEIKLPLSDEKLLFLVSRCEPSTMVVLKKKKKKKKKLVTHMTENTLLRLANNNRHLL